jgi:hypothetical protein
MLPLRAHSFVLRMCSDPICCTPHIIALDEDDNEICYIAIPVEGAPAFIQALQNMLYMGAVERD